MIYFGTPSSPAIRAAMDAGELGCITSPMQGNRIPRETVWCADNGRFGKGWPGRDRYLRWLTTLEPIADRCQFALAPDVPFDMHRSLDFSMAYVPEMAAMGFPVALALQNGAEHLDLPWDDIDAVFIAGDTAWKLSLAAKRLMDIASTRGKWVHFARVNSGKRLRYATGAGADSSDGTLFKHGPDINLGRFENWRAIDRRRGIQGVLV